MVQRIVLLGVAVSAVTLGLWWQRARPAYLLEIRRIAPAEYALRGSPHNDVLVELDVANTSRRSIELAPLKLSCSCQLARAPEKMIPVGGSTRVALNLRYPAAHRTVTPVEFKSISGELLGRTEIVLEANLDTPFFIHCPERIEISLIDGVSEPVWTASVATVEDAAASPHVTGATIVDGAEWVRVTLGTPEASPAQTECQRTYPLQFEILEEAFKVRQPTVPRATVDLELSDGSRRSMACSLVRKPPLVLSFDAAEGSVRAIRRGGARGPVTLHCIPEGSGMLWPDRFDEGQSIVAQLQSAPTKPMAVEARYQGTAAVVPVSLPLP